MAKAVKKAVKKPVKKKAPVIDEVVPEILLTARLKALHERLKGHIPGAGTVEDRQGLADELQRIIVDFGS